MRSDAELVFFCYKVTIKVSKWKLSFDILITSILLTRLSMSRTGTGKIRAVRSGAESPSHKLLISKTLLKFSS